MIAPNGTVYVDNTTLRATAECDSKLALRHVLGYAAGDGLDEAYPLVSGTVAHEVLASHLRGKPLAYCLAQF
jgi:hypothetical protein